MLALTRLGEALWRHAATARAIRQWRVKIRALNLSP